MVACDWIVEIGGSLPLDAIAGALTPAITPATIPATIGVILLFESSFTEPFATFGNAFIINPYQRWEDNRIVIMNIINHEYI